METISVTEKKISPSALGQTLDRVKRVEKPNDQERLSDKTRELGNQIARGEEAAKNLTDEAVKGLAAQMNKVAETMRYSIQFVVDRKAGGIIIKVLDNEGKLIRQIPPEVMTAVSSAVGMDLGFLLNAEI